MEYQEHEEPISSGNASSLPNLPQSAQVPPTLLPTVLERLGLTSEQTRPDLSIDGLRAKLRSGNWEERVAAVRMLARVDAGFSLELLVSALNDEDSSVRAAAVQALGRRGARAPLQRLVEAVHDPDWHVRETALLALAKQGQHVPKEVLLTALHDTDASVREAATFALHWRNASVSSGKLWEQHTMQQDIHNTTNDNERRPPDEVVPSSTWNGSGESREGRGRSERFESEQMQEYVPQEFAAYEFGGAMSPHQGKLVPRLHRPQWKWWIALLVVAIASFLLGSGISISMSVPKMGIVPSVVQLPQKGVPPAERPFPMNPKYAWIVQDDVAQGLHLAPQEIASRLRGGMSIVDIAASQGVSALELRAIELKAVSDLLNTAVKAGDIAPDQVGSWLKQFQANPQLLDKIVTALFLTNP